LKKKSTAVSNGNVTHKLRDILFIVFATPIANADEYLSDQIQILEQLRSKERNLPSIINKMEQNR